MVKKMKVKATTKDLVVVDPETFFDPHGFVLFDGKYVDFGRVAMARLYVDHMELDFESQDSDVHKKTRKFYYHDLLQMNETLHLIKEGEKIDHTTT